MRLEVVGPLAGVGEAGLQDRPSPTIRRAWITAKVEDRMVYLRRSWRCGPDRIKA